MCSSDLVLEAVDKSDLDNGEFKDKIIAALREEVDPSKDKYYAVVLLGMDAREYTLVNYLYALAKALVGFTLDFSRAGKLETLFSSRFGFNFWHLLTAGARMKAAVSGAPFHSRSAPAESIWGPKALRSTSTSSTPRAARTMSPAQVPRVGRREAASVRGSRSPQ